MRSRKAHGFTLVELMIIVGIIGILAAIAIPAFSKYVRRSRTTEAPGYLNKMWAGSVAYYTADLTNNGFALPKQFPGPSGQWEHTSVSCCLMAGGKCAGGSSLWSSDPVWVALKFGIPDPHSYLPGYTGSGEGSAAKFTAVALGNLDCDAVNSEFRRDGYITSTGDVAGQTQPIVINEME